VAVRVRTAYETPHMLFTANHTPARNLAAAVASVLALALFAAAAPERLRVVRTRRAAAGGARADRRRAGGGCGGRRRMRDGAVDAGGCDPRAVPAPGRDGCGRGRRRRV